MPELPIEFLCHPRVHLFREIAEHDIAGRIPRRVARPASWIAALLPPTLFRGPHRMMAGEALQLGILRPGFSFRAPREPLECCAQLDGLPGPPFAHAGPGTIFGEDARRLLSRHVPMTRHHRRE